MSYRRHLYWTNSQPSTSNIVQAMKNGTILNTHQKDVFLPRGIIIDHYANKVYWVEKKYGDEYSIESSDLELKNLSTMHTGSEKEPMDIANSNTSVYWTDQMTNGIYKTNMATTQTDRVYTEKRSQRE
ncbi:AGAP007023-PA-like protein [Anopheles sinensis]|uniref:AGAP007023-PA-like protein n=1 Tax=Anopheles sinensis TaxID=74873 RepID=A0A084W9Y5_ANOSI|nr:AGAP007023-PA-like protein [Anopheles sinensis]